MSVLKLDISRGDEEWVLGSCRISAETLQVCLEHSSCCVLWAKQKWTKKCRSRTIFSVRLWLQQPCTLPTLLPSALAGNTANIVQHALADGHFLKPPMHGEVNSTVYCTVQWSSAHKIWNALQRVHATTSPLLPSNFYSYCNAFRIGVPCPTEMVAHRPEL